MIKEIIEEDMCNDCYGRERVYLALKRKFPKDSVPSKRTCYKIMKILGLVHRKRRKPKGITKADKAAMKSDDLLRRDFSALAPFQKVITDITEVKTRDGKLYISGLFDCYNSEVLAITMDTNMQAELCSQMIINAKKAFPELRGAIAHSDRGTQYTSELYRRTLKQCGLVQSMNSAGGRCHDNARCESMWARFKEELIYGRYKTEKMSIENVKQLVWRYFMSYWNNRRIFTRNGGLSPAEMRKKFFETQKLCG